MNGVMNITPFRREALQTPGWFQQDFHDEQPDQFNISNLLFGHKMTR
jgi:hypothetical protein